MENHTPASYGFGGIGVKPELGKQGATQFASFGAQVEEVLLLSPGDGRRQQA